MDWKLKKMCPAVTATLLAVTGFLNADYQQGQPSRTDGRDSGRHDRRDGNYVPLDCCPKPECEVCCPCPNQEIWGCEMEAYPCSPRIREHTNEKTGQTVQFDTTGVYANLDILVWKSQMDNLSPATEQTGTAIFAQSRFTDARFEEMSSKWKPGVRVGLGYYLDRDVWDVYACYTYYKGKATESENVTTPDTTGETLFDNWSAVSGNTDTALPITINAFDADWSVRLNLVDLELGRRFRAGKWLVIRPFVGARGAWIRHNVDYDYFNAFGGGLATPPPAIALHVDMRNKYSAAGLRAGLNTEWNWGCGLSVYGNSAVSILYGMFDVFQQEIQGSDVCCDTNNIILSITDKFKSAKAVIDLQLGLRWASYMCNSNNRFVFSAGWEQHLFINQNQLKRFWSISHNNSTVSTDYATYWAPATGDFGTEGFMVSALFEF